MHPLARNEDGETQLHFFAYFGNPLHIEALLKAGADIMAKDKSGFTPLHQVNNPENVSILIKAGADILAQDMDGLTPLHAAAGDPRANIEVVQALINSGANPMIKDIDGMSPLHLAARDGHPDAPLGMLEAGADTFAGQIPLIMKVNSSNITVKNRGTTPKETKALKALKHTGR